MEKGNNLKSIRIREGLTIAGLSRFANVSTKVISQTEKFVRNPTLVTKNKIVNGLNEAASKGVSKRKYTLEEVFSDVSREK
ncbi:MAG: hypothetical protein B5M53_09545 [Candidatus Cloacimonas sp. 4484_209]|nr:MAG: hypothetical protein B5M53_09545 [Candidatus Cloacimonas sp. 4484_209]